MGRRSGLTLTELLVVLGVAAIVLIAFAQHNASARVAGAAQGVAREVSGARLHAVIVGADAQTACLHGARSAVVGVAATWPTRGLAFGPDGLPRTCDGGGVGNTTILLEHRGRQAAVIVSSLGRVRWEMR
jgi:prepilin-type N-terminal cleavage/methylation domain-containing protein